MSNAMLNHHPGGLNLDNATAMTVIREIHKLQAFLRLQPLVVNMEKQMQQRLQQQDQQEQQPMANGKRLWEDLDNHGSAREEEPVAIKRSLTPEDEKSKIEDLTTAASEVRGHEKKANLEQPEEISLEQEDEEDEDIGVEEDVGVDDDDEEEVAGEAMEDIVMNQRDERNMGMPSIKFLEVRLKKFDCFFLTKFENKSSDFKVTHEAPYNVCSVFCYSK